MTDTTKATEPVIPQDKQINDPGYTNKDLHEQTLREIAQAEPPKDPEPPETPVPPKEPELTLEEMGNKIARDAAEKVLEEERTRRKEEEEKIQVEAQKLKPEEDEYAVWEKALWEKDKRPPTYREALDFMTQQAEKRIEQKQLERQKAVEAEETKKQEEAKQFQETGWKIINNELAELYKHNVLTPIKDPNNPSDQGVVEKDALLNQMLLENQRRTRTGEPEILSVALFHQYYFKKPVAQPPGADAPIQGNKGSAVTPSQEQTYSYQDLKKPWSFFRTK